MIGAIIKKARVANKMTTRQLAEKANITQSMVSRYESGKVLPTKEVLSRLSVVLKISRELKSKEFKTFDDFNQREFDSKLAKAKSLGVVEKRALLIIIDSFLKNRDTETLVSKWQ